MGPSWTYYESLKKAPRDEGRSNEISGWRRDFIAAALAALPHEHQRPLKSVHHDQRVGYVEVARDRLMSTRLNDLLDGTMPFQPARQLLWPKKEMQHTAGLPCPGLGRRVKDERAYRQNVAAMRDALPLATLVAQCTRCLSGKATVPVRSGYDTKGPVV